MCGIDSVFFMLWYAILAAIYGIYDGECHLLQITNCWEYGRESPCLRNVRGRESEFPITEDNTTGGEVVRTEYKRSGIGVPSYRR